MWAGRVGERRQEKGLGATGGRAGPTRARPPRHQKSADLDVLSGSSSGDESSSTEEEGSSNAQRYSLRHIPAFVGSTSGDDEEEWEEGRAKHVRCKRGTLPPAKPLKPTPHDGSGGGTSNPSPQSTDTAQVSSSSFGTVVAGGSEGRDSRSASQDQAATPLTNWVDDSAGWELAGEGTGTTRERQALRAEQRRRQERVREEAAVAAAAEVAAAGGDVNAVAAAAVAAAAAAADREGFGRSGPRARRQQQQQQPRPSQPPRQPGKLRVKDSHGGGGGGGGGDNDEDGADADYSVTTAVAADGQRVRLSTNDFKTPVRRPLPDAFAAEAAPATGQYGVCQLCAPASAKSGGPMPMPEAQAVAAGARACGCRPAERRPADMFAQTGEMEFRPPAAGARGFGAAAGPTRAEGASFGPLGESQLVRQLARAGGSNPMKEEKRELASSSHGFNYSRSPSSSSSRGRGREAARLLAGKHSSGSDTIDSSLRSRSLLAADEVDVRRAESLVEVIDHHPELEGSNPDLVDSFRTASLRDTGSSLRTTARATSLRDTGSSTGSSTGSFGSRRRDSGGSERRRRRGILGGLKKGMGVVWEKISADHPEPLPIDKTLSKEEQKVKHLQTEIRRRNDWQTNSMAEQHVLRSVMMQEEEKVTT